MAAPDARHHHVPFLEERAGIPGFWQDPVTRLTDFYLGILRRGGPRIAEGLETLAEAGSLPAVFYCTAGKDRRGASSPAKRLPGSWSDEKERYPDNIFVERLWRTVKYEEVYLNPYSNGRETKAGLDAYFHFYHTQRPHQAQGYRTPAEVFNRDPVPSDEQSTGRRRSPGRTMVSYTGATGPSLNLAPILSN